MPDDDRPAARTPPRGRARGADPASLPPEDRAAILAALDEGLSRNAIARRVHRSRDTVTRVVEDAGRSFDRTATDAATTAVAVDRRAQRTASSGRLLDALDAVVARALGPASLTPHEVASLARATVDLTNAHARLVELTPDTEDRDRAMGLLGGLSAYLQANAGEYEHPEDVHPLGPALDEGPA